MIYANAIYLYSSNRLEPLNKGHIEKILPEMDSQHFFGLFETVLIYNGRAVFIQRHLDRMYDSCQNFCIGLPGKKRLLSLIGKFLKDNLASGTAVLKVSVYGMDNNATAIFFTLKDYPYDLSKTERGIRLTVAASRRDENSTSFRHKITHRFEMDQLRKEVISKGFDDVLFLNLKGNVCETSKANIFAVFGDTVITPPQTEGLLKGVVCDYLLKNNLKGITFKEAPITLPEIFKADEVFVTNSLI
ncbi:MAG: aminotransferase class IV, partial [Actinobacteria bacterium]|nr:aminotransferase class IV [Actinomycetota bacterium]